MPDGKRFFSKLILFGEYSLISGSKALALPLYNFSGRLVKSPDKRDSIWEFNEFADYLINSPVNEFFNIDKLKKAKVEGLFFDSDIPVGYGVGSSGALCAAIYYGYAYNPLEIGKISKDDLPFLKNIFSVMESFFHGQSSGIDPLVSYAGRPLLLNSPEDMELSDNVAAEFPTRFFLFDSGIYAETSNLVKSYIQRMHEPEYSRFIQNEYIPLVNGIVKSFTASPDIRQELLLLSEYQLHYFSRMIPQSIIPIWVEGLESGKYCLKLCGSGGGGFFTVFAFDNSISSICGKSLIPVKLD